MVNSSIPEALKRLETLTGPRVAAFDADGVLWRGDVSEDFTRWMIERGHFDGARWERYEKINAADPAAGCLEILRFYEGLPAATVLSHVETFWETGPERDWIEPVTLTYERLSDQGFDVFVVSGTPEIVLLPLLVEMSLHPKHLIALEMSVDDEGRFTGAHEGIPTTGSGKAQRLAERTSNPIHLAVGNSVLDVEMLKKSEDVKWVIEPDDTLRGIAINEGWLISDFEESAP